MQRQRNNFCTEFSENECITVYLWGISLRKFEQKAIYGYTSNYLLDRLPKLPSYTVFSRHLNALAPSSSGFGELSPQKLFRKPSLICLLIICGYPFSSAGKWN